MGADG